MSIKKYYDVEFTIVESVWAENEDEAYTIARRRLMSVDNPLDLMWNYDDCVTESDNPDWEDPDAPKSDDEDQLMLAPCGHNYNKFDRTTCAKPDCSWRGNNKQ